MILFLRLNLAIDLFKHLLQLSNLLSQAVPLLYLFRDLGLSNLYFFICLFCLIFPSLLSLFKLQLGLFAHDRGILSLRSQILIVLLLLLGFTLEHLL